jgi:acyl-CoA synthetase (AMP-forming)/AMP-acid ligase II
MNLVYDSDLFDAARMDELMDQLVDLLARVADNPDLPVVDSPLATARAADLLPAPALELPGEWRGGVHAVSAARAAEAPDRVAVTADGVAWSYGALDRASARLARGLADAGVRRGDRVAIVAQRSPSLPLAILGSFRAGAGYTILDPAHPGSHLVTLAERARPRAVLRLADAGPVPEELAAAFAALDPCLDLELPPAASGPPEGGPLSAWPAAAPDLSLTPDDEACLTFTSGTTGTPKGIVGRHGPLSHFVPWQRERFGLTADDRHGMLSGLSHDPLQRDMFTPLQIGATLCVPPPDDVLRPARVFDWLRRERVSVIHLTPAMGQIVTAGGAESDGTLPALRRAYFVGEQLSAALIDEVALRAPAVECFNFYGTTETQRADPCEEHDHAEAKHRCLHKRRFSFPRLRAHEIRHGDRDHREHAGRENRQQAESEGHCGELGQSLRPRRGRGSVFVEDQSQIACGPGLRFLIPRGYAGSRNGLARAGIQRGHLQNGWRLPKHRPQTEAVVANGIEGRSFQRGLALSGVRFQLNVIEKSDFSGVDFAFEVEVGVMLARRLRLKSLPVGNCHRFGKLDLCERWTVPLTGAGRGGRI